MIRLIVAIDQKRGMAKHGHLPWDIPEDREFYAEQTKKYGGQVLMGRATWGKPLPDRTVYVLTHSNEPIEGATLVHDLNAFLDEFKDKDLWVVGGAEVFQQVMDAGKADELYITHIDAEFGCDRFFPEYEDKFELKEQTETHHQHGFSFRYAIYTAK